MLIGCFVGERKWILAVSSICMKSDGLNNKILTLQTGHLLLHTSGPAFPVGKAVGMFTKVSSLGCLFARILLILPGIFLC